MPNVSFIPGRISELIEELGFETKKQFYTHYQIDPNTLNKAIKGEPVRFSVAKRLADHFDLPLKNLTAENGKPEIDGNQSGTFSRKRHLGGRLDSTVYFDGELFGSDHKTGLVEASVFKPTHLWIVNSYEAIRWRFEFFPLDDQRQGALTELRNFCEGESDALARENQIDTFEYQLTVVRDKSKITDLLELIGSLGLGLYFASYNEHQLVKKLSSPESGYGLEFIRKPQAAIGIVEKRRKVNHFSVYLGDPLPKYTENDVRTLIIDGKTYELPKKPPLSSQIPDLTNL